MSTAPNHIILILSLQRKYKLPNNLIKPYVTVDAVNYPDFRMLSSHAVALKQLLAVELEQKRMLQFISFS